MNILRACLVMACVTLAYGGPCDSVLSISTSWPGGYTATLLIPISSSVTSWKIDLTLSATITNLEVWNAASSTSDQIHFSLINMSYNGVQTAGTTFNTVGFNVWYPSTNPMPTITQVLFNGANVCSASSVTTVAPTTTTTTTTTTKAPTTQAPITKAPTTQAPTTGASTTTTTTTTTQPPATTSQPGSCGSAVSISSSWPGGYTATLIIPIASTVSSWSMDVTFSAAISSLQVWNAAASSSSNIKFTLVSMSYNGFQSAGTILNSVGFNVYFPSGNQQPSITSIVFNGVNICSGSAVVTTSPSSTTSTSSSTAAPATVSTTTAFPTTTTTGTTPAPLNGTKYNYADVIAKSLLFYYAQRSGPLPTNENPIPYRLNSALNDKGQNGEDLTGGYYDAGDHVKFGFPMAAMTTVVAWSAVDYALGYSSAGQTAQVRSMLKWSTDYFIKAHVSPMQFYGQVGDGNVDHAYWGRPEDMTMARPAYFISSSAPGSDLAGETAAALAATSMVFAQANPTYSALCLSHARDLYTLATQYLGKYSDAIPNAANFYNSWSSYGDELAWAAVWMYRATNQTSYLNDAKAFYNQYGLSKLPGAFSWDDKTAGVQVLLAKITGDPTYLNSATAFCNAKVSQPKTPKGLLFTDTWGPLRYAANIAFVCLQAAELSVPASTALSYRQLARQQIYYVLGDTGRSFVCGFGVNPPVKPHHRSSSCPNKPATCDWNNFNYAGSNPQILYGALVGGPDSNDNYVDDRTNYVTNEVATDYNAGFQAAVAALQSLAAQGIFA